MAYRRELERSSSVPYINYLDGVAFKISERYSRPNLVSLPVSYHQKNPHEVLNREYDFTVENEIIRWADEMKQSQAAREAQAQSMREAEAHLAFLGTANSAAQNDLDILASANDSTVLDPVVANMSNEVLQPVPLNQPLCMQNNQNRTSSRSFDISDFEGEASDPFETTELKTLNDMEELSRVLQSSYPNASPSNTGDANVANTQNRNQTETVSFQASTGHVSFSRGSDQNHSQQVISNGPTINTPLNYTTNINGFYGSHNSPQDPFIRQPPLPPIQSPRSESPYTNCTANRSSSMPDISGQMNYSSGNPEYASYPESLSFQTAVVSDCTTRSATPPPPYLETGTLSSYTPLPPSPNPHHSDSRPIDAPPAYSERDNILPNPYNTLLEKEKRFIDDITDMGFPQHRVARCVQSLGEDKKQVIETLCAIDSLVAVGYPEEYVEMALNLQDNEEQAIEFLKLLQQFEELGFKQEEITRQLILHGNNQEKVLDGLTA
ncbi:uncharacterized protein LOC102801716 isoform X2 [Saccoglossus kowalevskii]|uniref:Ubiquitin-associated protein 1-like isoform X2 n=1 Tax=Saccoglossus kowalevskii TaxID=10224 RepID=A0ABM0ME91_SACKO|nr:PREDICTED: ubiquitin-associated protein 1-like isoform X2 [Saccoglossus kowalevskii]